jgi:predicted nucleic acid-binding protein
LRQLVPPKSLYLDSNVFIGYLEGAASDSETLKRLFESLRDGSASGVTSELTLGEVLAGSHKRGPQAKRAYLDLIVWSKAFELVPVSRDILYQSADLCAAHKQLVGKKLILADAIHLATAIQTKCGYFVSADKGIVPPEGITKVGFDVAVIDRILEGGS